MPAHVCHIKVNGVSWCQCPEYSRVMDVVWDRNFRPRPQCSWTNSKDSAIRVAAFIREQAPEAAVEVVEGPCDQRDSGE